MRYRPLPEEALSMIKSHEGLHKVRQGMVYPYPDVAHGWKVATQGYGTTVNPETRVKLGKSSPPITAAKAGKWLTIDLQKKYLPAVDRGITRRVHPLCRGALGSFTYNVGTGNFRRSTLRKRINNGDVKGIIKEWRKWRMAGGRVYPGLVRRREEELALFLKGWNEQDNSMPYTDTALPQPPQIYHRRSFWRKLLDWIFGS